MNRRSFIAALLALPLLKHLPRPKPPSLLDICKRHDAGMLPVVEALHRTNPFLRDMTWVESNAHPGWTHIPGGPLPQITWKRKIS